MERIENFICNWNAEFPDHALVTADLKVPHSVMGALFQVFDRLGIDRDAVLMPPPEEERDQHTVYYWDLLPVINMCRVINHVVSVMPQVNNLSICITHFLQPTVPSTHSIMLLLFNLMIFNEVRLRDIAPYEEELFAKRDQVKQYEDRKFKLLEMLNEQAQEKGKRAERLLKIDDDIRQYEDELKQEKEAHEEEKAELETVTEENRQLMVVIDQKKSQRETLLTEVARKKALRVYDAEDIKAQVEQSAQNVQEAEEKLNLLEMALKQKENSLKNLQSVKPNLDVANNLLHEINKLSESLKDYDTGDLDTESKEGELEMLNTELSELQSHLNEVKASRDEAARKREESRAKRQKQKVTLESALREAEEKDKKSRERVNKAEERTMEIKELTSKYEEEKCKGMGELTSIEGSFKTQLKSFEETLLQKARETEKKIEDKIRIRQ